MILYSQIDPQHWEPLRNARTDQPAVMSRHRAYDLAPQICETFDVAIEVRENDGRVVDRFYRDRLTQQAIRVPARDEARV